MHPEATLQSIRKETAQHDALLSLIFRALSDPGRFRIFRLLIEHEDLCVSEIAKVFKQSLPAVSQQLKILEMTGLLQKVRTGQTVCYHLKKDEPMVKTLARFVKSVDTLV